MAGPNCAVAITKETQFHGKIEEFSNVYYYNGPSFQAGDANYERLARELAEAEKLVHSAEVTFKNARVWSAGGTILQNVTLGIYDLEGKGTLASGWPMSAENAVLLKMECERPNVLGRKVYLRKYIRSQMLPPAASDAQARQKVAIAPDAQIPYKAFVDKIDLVSIDPGVLFQLVSPTGRTPRALNNGAVDQFVRTREFRRN
jgi:hypothetical protein